ncbi:hypothetical protein L596_018686 [Steinernema carpocapsae]|uniref:Replication protein A C-terminal domain-containing protein n=1 Tax=Steinernema carpocapsae TaxID=34508 RepID=A0A4U5N678_STECR|nr:hypothetical protein L596_018686 [Steinernema carpocapsae]
MMDATYDAGGAGGWGEFGASQSTSTPAAGKPSALERLPVFVTVKELCHIPEGEEKISIGGLSFTNVRVVGTVGAITASEDNAHSTEYSLQDISEPQYCFTVVNYVGLNPDARDTQIFNEGARIHAVGKVRSFDGRLIIVAYQVREIESDGEFEAFELEAKIGRHFFENNLQEAHSGMDLTRYDKTILSSHCRGNRPTNTVGYGGVPATPGGAAAQGSFFSPPAKRARTDAPMVDESKGLAGQKLRIYQYIVNNSEPTVGVNIRTVKGAIGGDSNFSNDVAYLTDEGHIYNTHDDDHYAPI